MRRLRANGMVVSQKTYLELDDVVPSWIEAVVANFSSSHRFQAADSRFVLVEANRAARPNEQLVIGKTVEFGVHLAWLHVAIENRYMSLCLVHYPRSTIPRPSGS
jgi:hypothetical protein